ncbi:MAG TPA: tetratricopeptide repeat protein, partial [Terriglobia bacterium]|nr:tetratricopeptide repeat protein [Terriglobia bacterium]
HRQVSAETVTADFADSFGIEDSVVEGASRMLGISGAGQGGVKDRGTTVASAFSEYLQGLGYLQEYQQPGNLDEAVDAFQSALKLDGSFAPAHAGLGDAYWRKYEVTRDMAWTGRARQACAQAVKINPNLAASHLCLGIVANGTGQFEQAAAEFQQAIALDPKSEEAYHGLANAYRGLGKSAETEEAYQRAILLRPNYWAPYNWLGDFYANTGRYAEAATMFQRVTSLAPENYLGFDNLGAMDYRLHRWDEAERMFKRSIELKPSAMAYSNLGTLYFYQGRYAPSARQFEQAVQLKPKDEAWWVNLADAYRWTPGEKEKAPAAYNMAIGLARDRLMINPRSAETLAVLALCEAKLGHKNDATAAIRRAVNLNPEDPQNIYIEALVSHLTGDRAGALDFLRKAVAKGYPVSEILAEPEWNNLASDSEFKKIVAGPGKKES